MANLVIVCKFDGTKQCGSGTARPLEDDAAVLKQLGAAKIYGQVNVQGPFATCKACHICPSGMVNAFAITQADWDKIAIGFPGPSGFKLWEGAPYPQMDLGGDGIVEDVPTPRNTGRSLLNCPTMIKDLSGLRLRVIREDEPYTDDYVADRVNLIIDDCDRIVEVFCG